MIKKNKQGFTLVELIFVLVIAGVLMMLEMSKKQAEFDQLQARTLGVEIYQISNAVARFNSYYSGNDDFVPESEYTDLDFLRDADDDGIDGCNDDDASTPSLSFIDCDFLPDNETSFGDLGFVITVEKIDTVNEYGDDETYLKSKIVFDILTRNMRDIGSTTPIEREAKSLSGLAALVASGATTVGSSDSSLITSLSTISYCLTDSLDDCETDDIGHIVSVTSDDSSTQIWLRVDNGNTMQNILEFGGSVSGHDDDGFSLRQIKNVARIYNENDVGGVNSALILGGDGEVKNTDVLSSELSTAGVVVDADMLLYKKLAVLSDASILGTLTVGGDTEIGGNLTVEGESLVKQDSTVEGNSTVLLNSDLQGDVDVGNDLGVVGNTELNGTLTVDLAAQMNSTLDVDTSISTPIIYDKDDLNYYVDPASISNLNTLIVDTQAELPSDTYITINGTKRLLSSLLGTYVHMFTATVSNGNYVPYPTCDDGGTAKIILTALISPIRTNTNSDVSGSTDSVSVSTTDHDSGAIYSYASGGTSGWTVYMGAKSTYGTITTGARSNANVYCSYELR